MAHGRCYRQRPMASPRPAVYGRDREKQHVSAFLTGALERPAALVLQGEPGMGKTTLWRKVCAEDASERGFEVLSSAPASGETRLSFSVLSDLVGDHVADVRDELPAPATSSAGSSSAPRRARKGRRAAAHHFRGDADAASRAGRARSVLIAIDDLQWLDESSAEALAFCFPPIRRRARSRRSWRAERTKGHATPDTCRARGRPRVWTGRPALGRRPAVAFRASRRPLSSGSASRSRIA